MCAFTACVRFLRRRGPAGLRNLFFGYSVVIFALPSVCPKHGNIHVAIGVYNVFSNSPESGSKSFSGAGMLPSPKESHTAAHRGKHGVLLCMGLVGYNKPEDADVRVYSERPFPQASRPRRAAYSVVSYSKLVSELTK